jgi:HlyD family secretion protein
MRKVLSFCLLILFGMAAAGCNAPPPSGYQGYAEGEFVLVASPYAGALESLQVSRGQEVAAAAPLFSLEQGNETAGRREAEERLRVAQAKLDNLRKGSRAPELEARQAEAEQAEAARQLSASQLQRDERLFADGFISSARLDEARANLKRDQARLEQAQAQLRMARQSVGRVGELVAAQAEVDAARAVLAQAEWRLAQRALRAPQAALVHDTFYAQGEWVPAGKPVVSLLPRENIKLRFFVPEAVVGGLRIGQKVSAACDGCGAPVSATVSYVSPNSEFTPPILYSKDARAKLVFMVEAKPGLADAPRLKPGQPVDVML